MNLILIRIKQCEYRIRLHSKQSINKDFMNDLQVKQFKVLEETVQYYSEDTNRRCANGMCSYSPEKQGKQGISNGCAVGRLLDPELRIAMDKALEGAIGSGVSDNRVFAMLPKEVQDLQVGFLINLQDLHDSDCKWGDRVGLTERGKNAVEVIKARIENLSYTK